ncbi:MAG TPA: Ig-like domain-containing protein [Thermoanaerobaculia bacterium]|nr:Ig-like domain-containing protein [Thermoanaerobaculia bacterium]
MNARSSSLVLLAILLSLNALAQPKKVLFDAMHAQTAGNADWVLDEDQCGTAQQFPTPDQSQITASTPETFWSGGFSAMGVDFVKKGFHVESLPKGARLTFGDSTNAQDLAHYDVFVIPEPNIRFTSAEITAIRNYVQNGGGLLLICDHAGADRNNDGFDPPKIFNELVGSPSVFGIEFNGNKNDTTLGSFNDHPDANYTSDASSPIIGAGAFGVPGPNRGLGLFGSTSMVISGNAKGHIWRTTSTHDTPTGVTFATSTFGSGRIAAVGDSSPSEDATNNCNHTTHPGYTETMFDNALIFANAVAWLASGAPSGGGEAPTVSITAPANGAIVSGSVAVAATASDNVGVTKVELSIDGTLLNADMSAPFAWTWDSTSVADGAHTLTATAFDADGHTATSSVTVTANNHGGGGSTTGMDISGWKVVQASAALTFTIPAGTTIPANGYVVIGRDASKSEFESFWGVTLGSDVVYLDGHGAFPQINGSEKYTLKNASGTIVDGATVAMPSGAARDVRRKDPCVSASSSSNWTIAATTTATPGSGAATGCAKGVIVNEFSDATSQFKFEFVELHNDQ